VESVKLPPGSPNLNAHAERFVRSIRECCLERLILFGESSLRTAVQNFVIHYHLERNLRRWESPDLTGSGPPHKHRHDSAPRAIGWHAEVLLSSAA
jgi:hypothetical protein